MSELPTESCRKEQPGPHAVPAPSSLNSTQPGLGVGAYPEGPTPEAPTPLSRPAFKKETLIFVTAIHCCAGFSHSDVSPESQLLFPVG